MYIYICLYNYIHVYTYMYIYIYMCAHRHRCVDMRPPRARIDMDAYMYEYMRGHTIPGTPSATSFQTKRLYNETY